jgi:ATP-dependent helicase/nuclease subunit B
MSTFLEQMAAAVIAKHGYNLGSVRVLLPTRRACFYFREALRISASGHAMLLPDITTMQDWVTANCGYTKSDNLELLMVMHQIHVGAGGVDDFDLFLPQARTILTDFDEMDMHLVNQEQFFRDLNTIASLTVYEPATELSPRQVNYLHFWQMFKSLYDGLHLHIAQTHKTYTGHTYRVVAERAGDIIRAGESFTWVGGFNGLTKAEEAIVHAFIESGKGEVVWDADEYYVKDNFQEAGIFFRKYLQKWKDITPTFIGNSINSEEKKIEIISVARNIGMARLTASILQENFTTPFFKKAWVPEDTAIIILDEKLLQPLQFALHKNLGPYNISMGLSLGKSRVAELFLRLFEMHERAEKFTREGKTIRMYHKDVIALLQHPLAFTLLGKGFPFLDTIVTIRRNNMVFLSTGKLKSLVPGSETAVTKLFFAETDTTLYLQALTGIAKTLTDYFTVNRKGEELTYAHHILQIITHIAEHIATGKTNAAVYSVRALLKDELRNTRIPFEGEPLKGFQLMGLMETRCLDFKHVIVLSMNEGMLPAGKNLKSYVPHPLRNKSLFSSQEKDSISAYLFYRLLHHAEDLVVMYNTEGSEMGGGEKSRYILQLQHELKKKNPLADIAEKTLAVAKATEQPGEITGAAKTAELLERLRQIMTVKGISPTAIATYVTCKYKYYLRYLLGLREQDEIEETMEANTMGTAIHAVFEAVYEDVTGKPLEISWVRQVAKDHQRIEEALQRGFNQRFDNDALMQGENHLYYSISLKMIELFFANEIKQLEELKENSSSLTVLAVEELLDSTVQVGDIPVLIKGTSDRIELEGSILRIADFKSGKSGRVDLKQEELDLIFTDRKYAKHAQLLTYALAYTLKYPQTPFPIKSGIYWLQDMGKGFDALTIDGDSLLGRDAIMHFQELLRTLFAEMLDPAVPFLKTEDRDACRFCDFRGICKR